MSLLLSNLSMMPIKMGKYLSKPCIPESSLLGSTSRRSLKSLAPKLLTKHSKGSWVRSTVAFRIRVMSASMNSSSPLAAENEVREVKLLDAINDDHEGVIVNMKEPMDSKAFSSALRASIVHWKHQGKKGIWIQLPIELVNLVEPAVKEGFWYHHAEPKHLMLVYWIPEGIHTLPANASHRVGIGAFVMNDKREVLVVQEKSGVLRGKSIWKFPTGVVDEGEDICAAAVREVKEETAIEAEFVEVLSFRSSPFGSANDLQTKPQIILWEIRFVLFVHVATPLV
ncbi:nudix hydrolase 2-like isoform X2 [Tripterygium wilfordii]|uniref:nudix hydrolase 2-like isoform X2 n=1 Tax=Tripterygium wilfordii TaxID=458696 RepID=UPI0018F7F1C4|nr:nudix hydrolase 2-like isoform X2 [Tripterygium wilfordii]